MKLGELKSKIRGTKGSPVLEIELMPGTLSTVSLMKGPLMEALDAAFPGGKAAETGLMLDTRGDDAVLRPEAGGVYGIKATTPGPLLEIMEAPATPTLLIDLDDAPPAPKSTLLLDL